MNRNITIYCAQEIAIGDNCLFGSNILITDNNHGINPVNHGPYSQQELTYKGAVIIDENCWIAQNVCILAGTHIGKWCVIGAGSVVSGDIPDYSMVMGNPGKVVAQWDFEKNKWCRIKS